MLRKFICLLLAGGCAFGQAANAPTVPLTASTPAASSPAANTSTAAATPAANTIMRVGGSDLLQTAVGEPLTTYVRQYHLNVAVDMLGSVPALTGLKTGKIQIGILASPLGQQVAPPEFKAIPLCYQVDYLIVSDQNPINTLNLLQVADIYGSVQQDASTWDQLQLTGEWVSKPVIPYTTSADDGLVLELFKNLILGRQPLKPTVRTSNTPAEMVAAIGKNPNYIGLCGYDPGPPLKVLSLSTDQLSSTTSRAVLAGHNQGAFAPTPETVFNGDYPLRLPFYLVFKLTDKERVLPLLRVLLSDDYAKHLADEHFVPVPSTERARALLELDNSP
jgi:phosphate transport system substrate-binding protein